MKNLKEYLNESMSTSDLKSLEEAIKTLQQVGGVEKFEDKVFTGNDMDKNLIKILERYDEYMEDVMWKAIECESGVEKTAKEIKSMAEENEHSTGTESHFVVEFLEELIRYLKLD